MYYIMFLVTVEPWFYEFLSGQIGPNVMCFYYTLFRENFKGSRTLCEPCRTYPIRAHILTLLLTVPNVKKVKNVNASIYRN